MQLLTANTTDGAREKHVPVVTREGNTVSVNVGSVDHPMIPEHYIEWKKQGKGKARLKMELVQKGISREIIEEVLESTDFGETREMIRQIILKKRKTNIPMNEKEKQRLYGFLMRKGFPSSDILAVMREEEWRNNIEF